MNSMSGAGGPMSNVPSQAGNRIPKGYSYGQINKYSPQQEQISNAQYEYAGPDSFTAKLARGDQSAYAEAEAPALQQFAAQQGNLASRFSGMGGTGARRSSGFQNTMGQEGANFAQQLAANRLGLRNQAIKDLMGMSSELLGQRQYDQYLEKKPQNNTAEMVGKLGGAVPGLISSFTGGGSPGSAIKGALSSFGSFFGGG